MQKTHAIGLGYVCLGVGSLAGSAWLGADTAKQKGQGNVLPGQEQEQFQCKEMRQTELGAARAYSRM